ncbi:hypothetical protein [Stenomitos frigidus]|uniref:hypothetical protein n=1 Tax=Stenomitos frigidus TaxID=1886765 RepID=UPI0011B24D85|nr:hypothetical protein [Stenomitos frigidus]
MTHSWPGDGRLVTPLHVFALEAQGRSGAGQAAVKAIGEVALERDRKLFPLPPLPRTAAETKGAGSGGFAEAPVASHSKVRPCRVGGC